MRTLATLFLILFAFTGLQSQNQSINGNLHLTVGDGGTLRIGKTGDGGNTSVPLGGITGQYNIDFSGYRNMAPDHIGARIAALKFNAWSQSDALVQNTGLAFYTNFFGWNSGTTDLEERMRITPSGNVGIATSTPQALLDVAGTIRAQEVRIEGKLNLHTLDCEPTENSLASVLARLPEGNQQEEGTYLGVKTYTTQIQLANAKSFSLEHKFYGQLNSSIDFYRGRSYTGGYIGINVNNGNQIAKFHDGGLDIAGTVLAREVRVEVTAGADHVFNNEYKLKPLSEVENFIQANKHLPEVPSEKQMQTEGLNMNEFQIKLLQKIEELTLYAIQQEKRIQEQEHSSSEQKEIIKNLQTALSEKL